MELVRLILFDLMGWFVEVGVGGDRKYFNHTYLSIISYISSLPLYDKKPHFIVLKKGKE